MINSIPGFLVFPTQGNISRIYADTYSQEDRLKHLADLLQRMLEWQKASVEKINEVAEVVNTSGAADVAEFYNDIQTLKAEMLTVQGHILTLTSEIAEVSDDLDLTNASVGTLSTELGTLETSVGTLSTELGTLETSVGTLLGTLETSVGTLSTDVDALENAVDSLLGRVSAVEAGLQNVISEVSVSVETAANTSINFSRTKNGINSPYGSVVLKSSDASVTIDSVGNEIDLKAVGGGGGGGGTDPLLEGRVETIENEEFVGGASYASSATEQGFLLSIAKKTGEGVAAQEDTLRLEFESADNSVEIFAYEEEDNYVVFDLAIGGNSMNYLNEAVAVDSLSFSAGNFSGEKLTINRVEVEFEDETVNCYFGSSVIMELDEDGDLTCILSSELSARIQEIQPAGTVAITVFTTQQ